MSKMIDPREDRMKWERRIFVSFIVLVWIACMAVILGGCATSTKLVTRTPDPSLMVPCETPAAIPAKPTGNQIDKALVDATRIALDCKSRHDGLIEFENAAPKP